MLLARSPRQALGGRAIQEPESRLGAIGRLGMSPQPMSRESIEKKPRIRGADKVVASVCPYCAVGCSQLIYVKDRKIIDIEGNPDSPINEGTLCPKGASTYQYVVNPNRVTTVLYRAPYADHWEQRPLEWAMDRIAQRIKETRDATFVERTPDSKLVNQTTAIATLGGATMDNEENYLIKKLFNAGLGVVSIENQARI
jgi:formate dehydrogenase major subunit